MWFTVSDCNKTQWDFYRNNVRAYVLYRTNNITHGKGYVILMSNNDGFGEDVKLELSVTYTTSTQGFTNTDICRENSRNL
jgi:hypothetical protein